MPYTTHPFYTVTYNQPVGSVGGAGLAHYGLFVLGSHIRQANWLKIKYLSILETDKKKTEKILNES